MIIAGGADDGDPEARIGQGAALLPYAAVCRHGQVLNQNQNVSFHSPIPIMRCVFQVNLLRTPL
jgi:hypothetical protein